MWVSAATFDDACKLTLQNTLQLSDKEQWLQVKAVIKKIKCL